MKIKKQINLESFRKEVSQTSFLGFIKYPIIPKIVAGITQENPIS